MRATHHQRRLARQKQLFNDRRKRGQTDTTLLRRQHLNMITTANVANDDDVWLPLEVAIAKALHQADARARKLRRHRRIHVLVRSTDLVTCRLEQLGHSAHPGTADANKVNLQVFPLRRRMPALPGQADSRLGQYIGSVPSVGQA